MLETMTTEMNITNDKFLEIVEKGLQIEQHKKIFD